MIRQARPPHPGRRRREPASGRAPQLPLPLPPCEEMGRDSFVAGASNAEALAAIEGWRGWPDRRLALAGPPASGKTHLAHLWAGLSGARILPAAALGGRNPQDLAATPLVVEDADRALPAAAERTFLHLINVMRAEGQWLMITGRAAPARWPVRLPDLASRLTAFAVARIAEPDDALLSALLQRAFAARGMKADERLLGYLLRRMDRTAAAAQAIVARLDAAALAERAEPTVQFAGRVLGW